MNVKEASEKWRVSEDTVIKYIVKGYIFDLSIENNSIIIPDINKPYIKKWINDKVSNIDKIILYSIEKLLYTNYQIIGITKELFNERLKVLERENKIYPRTENPSYDSNIDFTIASRINNGVILNISVNPQLNISSQIGLINAKLK